MATELDRTTRSELLRALNGLIGHEVRATDGTIGSVKDFYFDDLDWEIRYLVVDTGKWLSKRPVLISPEAVGGKPDFAGLTLPVGLTKEQIRNSPSTDTDKPVSRQHETELRRYYGWPLYWGAYPGAVAVPPVGSTAAGTAIAGQQLREEAEEAEAQSPEKIERRDPHLRSVKEVTGYSIEAIDGSIGHVEDFIAGLATWAIRYMVVDTRNWLPGRKVLVAPLWIDAIDWKERSVRVFHSRNEIKNSPEFDPDQPVNREYEARLSDYYGRPRYWE